MTRTPERTEAAPRIALDALVAEKIMGWVWVRLLPEYGTGIVRRALMNPNGVLIGGYRRDPLTGDEEIAERAYRDVPRFSTDIVAAWFVAEKMRESGWTFSCDNEGRFGAWSAWFSRNPQDGIWVDSERGDADSLPLAICRAALKAFEASQ